MKPSLHSSSRLALRIASLLAVLAILPGTATARQDPVSFRVTSRLVIVDMVVRDSGGRLVTDLAGDDIALFEDGKQQDISFFEFRRAGTLAADTTGAAVETAERSAVLPSDEFTMKEVEFAAPREGVHLAFLIDQATVADLDLGLVREAIARFLDTELSPRDRFMVASVDQFGFHVIEPFTGEVATIRSAVDQLTRETRPNSLSFSRITDELAQIYETMPGAQDVRRTQAIARARTYLSNLEGQFARTAEAFSVLSGYLQTLPGRKHIVYFSSGYPVQAGQDLDNLIQNLEASATFGRGFRGPSLSQFTGVLRNHQYHRYQEKIIAELNRSQVAVYTVDARGLLPTSDTSRRKGSLMAVRGRQNRFDSLDLASPQEFLKTVAEESGGIAVYNQNDLEMGATHAYRDASGYYLIAYNPSTERKIGRYHKIEVKVNRDDIDVRYRKGYRELEGREVVRGDVLNAIKFPALFQDFSVASTVQTQDGESITSTVVPTRALDFLAEGDRHSCRVESYGILFDEDGQWVGGDFWFATENRISLSAAELVEFRQADQITIRSRARAEPGRYRLVVAVRQSKAGRIATWSGNIVIP